MRERELIVVGYLNRKAIVMDEMDRIYFLECRENEAPVGTVVPERGLRPIAELDPEEREKIRKMFLEL